MARLLRSGHTHEFTGTSSVVGGHVHRVALVTGRPIVINGNHVHRVRALSTFNLRHVHGISRLTGPAIQVAPGYHVHLVRINTNQAAVPVVHRHRVFGTTAIGPNIPASLLR